MGSWVEEQQEAVLCSGLHNSSQVASSQQVAEVEEESASQWEEVWPLEALVPPVDVQLFLLS